MEVSYLVEYVRDTKQNHKGELETRVVRNVEQLVSTSSYIRCYNRQNELQVPPIPLKGIFTRVVNITVTTKGDCKNEQHTI